MSSQITDPKTCHVEFVNKIKLCLHEGVCEGLRIVVLHFAMMSYDLNGQP